MGVHIGAPSFKSSHNYQYSGNIVLVLLECYLPPTHLEMILVISFWPVVELL